MNIPFGSSQRRRTGDTDRSDKTHKQYVVVVAGSHGSPGTKAGDSIIAYALAQ